MGFWSWFWTIIGIVYFISILVMVYEFMNAEEIDPNYVEF